MNGTFHIIKAAGEEIWLDGEDIKRITKYDEGEATSRFYVKIERKYKSVGLAQVTKEREDDLIFNVAAIIYYPNTQKKEEL